MHHFEYGEREISWLKKRDKRMGEAIERLGHIQRPGTPDLFTALIKYIVEQQISVTAARTVNARLVTECGGQLSPESLLALTPEDIQACGMTMKKAHYIYNAANAAFNGTLPLDSLPLMDDNAVIAQLTSLDGVGVWTAEMLLISSLNRPDVLSWGDLAIRRGIMRLYHHTTLPRMRFERYRRRYSPFGTTASLYLWALSQES